MNIFILDLNFRKCAEYHVDKHIVKMCTEQLQVLSTAHRVLDGNQTTIKTEAGRNKKVWTMDDPVLEDNLYKATHINHPCSIWARQSTSNYAWLLQLTKHLLDEYTYRYGKIHGSARLLPYVSSHPWNIPKDGLTPFALAMPDEYKVDDAVESYRNYYRGDKTHLFAWKNRPQPDWITLD